MKVVLQRVSEASLKVDNCKYSEIGFGLFVLVGFTSDDTSEDLQWMSQKILNIRLFNDEQGVMNRSVIEIKGELLVVSQFTLMARTKKGNRPSYMDAAPPEIAIPLYEQFLTVMTNQFGKEIKTGQFGADMAISSTNVGPITIVIDSKLKV